MTECGRQYDPVLQVSIATMVALNDHLVIQTDDRDQNPYGKEFEEDTAAR
jgi:hypothetical protein